MQAFLVAASTAIALVLQGCGSGGGHAKHPPAPELPTSCATTTTTTPSGNWTGYSCSSSRHLARPINAAKQKGFAVDDPTWATCSEQLVSRWPHSATGERVNSLRLFSAWKYYWNPEERQTAWDNIKLYLDNNDAKVLLSLDMTCDKENDEGEWQQAFALLKFLGKDRVMGMAFGNEMDDKKQCRKSFSTGAFFAQMKTWVDEMDEAGFSSVPLTVVWAMNVLANGGSAEHTFDPELEPFLRSAADQWGKRFVWTFNPYPLWDPNIIPTKQSECADKIRAALSDYTPNVMGECRHRVTTFTNSTDSIMWVGESGWSSPFASVQWGIKKFCPEWASEDTLFRFYEAMMDWDLSLPDDKAGNPQRGVDHMFFFTMRDYNYESFGLIKQCCDTECKIQAEPSTTTTATTTTTSTILSINEAATELSV